MTHRVLFGMLLLTSCDAIKDLLGDPTTDTGEVDGSPTDTGEDDDSPTDSGEEGDSGESTEWVPTEFDEPDETIQYDYLPLNRLIEEEWIVEDSMGLIPSAAYALEELHPEEEWLLAVEAGVDEDSDSWIMLDPTIDATMFLGDDPTLDPDGLYTVRGYASDGEQCATTGYEPLFCFDEIEHNDRLDGKPGGICVHLAVAHSLVDRLGIVSEEWADVVEGAGDDKTWGDKFLKALETSANDTDGTRGKTLVETNSMHGAEWNTGWTVQESTLGAEVADTSSNDTVRAWCNGLLAQINGTYDESVENEPPADCVLRLEKRDADDRVLRGHTMYISSVTWRDNACSILVVDTSKQDGRSHNYKGVKRNPGTQRWKLTKDGLTYEAGPKTSLWSKKGYNHVEFACWRKVRTEGAAEGRGSAMP